MHPTLRMHEQTNSCAVADSAHTPASPIQRPALQQAHRPDRTPTEWSLTKDGAPTEWLPQTLAPPARSRAPRGAHPPASDGRPLHGRVPWGKQSVERATPSGFGWLLHEMGGFGARRVWGPRPAEPASHGGHACSRRRWPAHSRRSAQDISDRERHVSAPAPGGGHSPRPSHPTSAPVPAARCQYQGGVCPRCRAAKTRRRARERRPSLRRTPNGPGRRRPACRVEELGWAVRGREVLGRCRG